MGVDLGGASPNCKELLFPVHRGRASSFAAFLLVKRQLEIGVLPIVLQNHGGVVGLAGFLGVQAGHMARPSLSSAVTMALVGCLRFSSHHLLFFQIANLQDSV